MDTLSLLSITKYCDNMDTVQVMNMFYGRHHWPLLNICVTNDHGYVPLVVNLRHITEFVARRVPLLEQELLTFSEHLCSPPVFSGVRVTRSLGLCVYFVDRCLSFCTFSFGHCAVCSSSIYGFWLLLWYLLAIVLSVLLRYTVSGYSSGIFWPLCCLFFFDIQILVTPLVSSYSSSNARYVFIAWCNAQLLASLILGP